MNPYHMNIRNSKDIRDNILIFQDNKMSREIFSPLSIIKTHKTEQSFNLTHVVTLLIYFYGWKSSFTAFLGCRKVYQVEVYGADSYR
jgi:hypothetical protein